VIRLVVGLALALAFVRSGDAHADNASVVEARKAVDEIRYDDARRLLVEALKQGANRPDELVEIYRLSAATAAVLGQPELAEQYYRRMLALAPDATLPPDASPRLREPFVAAQAYMAAQQRFDVRAARNDKGITVSIVDPLGMVVAVATLERGVVRGKQTSVPAVLEDIGDEVVALDEHGNFLRLIPLAARDESRETAALTYRRPFFERPLTYAIPAVAFAGAATFFFIDASRAKTRLDDILDNDAMHYFGEAEDERRHWRRSTIAAWVGAGLGAAFVTTAIVMATRDAPVRMTPVVGPDQAGVQLHAKF
jgi:tetratricopeptide (TPR) repeat protein